MTVGAILPLTGDIAAWGQNVRRGIDLALAGLPGIRVLYEDENFCNTARALTAAQSLVSQHGVRLIITGCLNGTKVITPFAVRNNLLILSAGLLSGEEREPITSQLLSLSGQISSEGRALADLILGSGLKRPAFIRVDDEFTSAVLRAVQNGLGHSNVLLDLPLSSQATDLGPLLLKAKQKGADALLAYLGEAQTLNLMRRRSEINLDTPVLSGYVIESNAFGADDMKWLEGIVYSYPQLAPSDNSARLHFEEQYRQEFGSRERPNSNSYFAFDGMNILGRAYARCRSDDPSCIRSFFLTAGPYSGVSGDFSFDKSGFVTRRFIRKSVRDGKFVADLPANG